MRRSRIEREKRTIERMIRLYCSRKEKHSELCAECEGLLRYAHERLERCPFGEGKTDCRHCAVHCYKPAMRNKIRQVMRYAGPRMLWYAPLQALQHLFGR